MKVFRTYWRAIGLICCLLLFGLGRGGSLLAQTGGPLPATAAPDGRVDYTFGQSLNFELELINDPRLAQISLFVDTPQLPNTYTVSFTIDAELGAVLKLNHQIDLKRVRLQPFTTITYWWTFTGVDGEQFELPSQSFAYEDDTYSWKRRAEGRFEIYWTTSDADLGQIAVDVGQEAIPQILSIIPGEGRERIRIYLYPSADDLQSALLLTGQTWVGGSASPELGVVMIPAENPRTAVVDLRRRLPHELSHLLLYEATGVAYRQVPRWLDEGLAVLFEAEKNQNFEPVLEQALIDESLIPFEQLCAWFPSEPEDLVFTAYAQSHAFVAYLQDQYGNRALQEMILAVVDGASCETMTRRVLNRSLAELEAEWLAQARPTLEPDRPSYALWAFFLLAGAGLIALLALGGSRSD